MSVESQIERLQATLATVDEEWTSRLSAVTSIRSLLAKNASMSTMYRPNWFIAQLKGPLCVQLQDRRSILAKQACATITELFRTAKRLGDTVPESHVATFLPTLFRLLPVTIKIIRDSADRCAWSLVETVPSSLVYVCHAARADAHQAVRGRCADYLARGLRAHTADDLAPWKDEIAKTIEAALADPKAQARAHAKVAFEAFRTHWPDEAEALLDRCDPAIRRRVQQQAGAAMPPPSTAPLGATSSNAPSFAGRTKSSAIKARPANNAVSVASRIGKPPVMASLSHATPRAPLPTAARARPTNIKTPLSTAFRRAPSTASAAGAALPSKTTPRQYEKPWLSGRKKVTANAAVEQAPIVPLNERMQQHEKAKAAAPTEKARGSAGLRAHIEAARKAAEERRLKAVTPRAKPIEMHVEPLRANHEVVTTDVAAAASAKLDFSEPIAADKKSDTTESIVEEVSEPADESVSAKASPVRVGDTTLVDLGAVGSDSKQHESLLLRSAGKYVSGAPIIVPSPLAPRTVGAKRSKATANIKTVPLRAFGTTAANTASPATDIDTETSATYLRHLFHKELSMTAEELGVASLNAADAAPAHATTIEAPATPQPSTKTEALSHDDVHTPSPSFERSIVDAALEAPLPRSPVETLFAAADAERKVVKCASPSNAQSEEMSDEKASESVDEMKESDDSLVQSAAGVDLPEDHTQSLELGLAANVPLPMTPQSNESSAATERVEQTQETSGDVSPSTPMPAPTTAAANVVLHGAARDYARGYVTPPGMDIMKRRNQKQQRVAKLKAKRSNLAAFEAVADIETREKSAEKNDEKSHTIDVDASATTVAAEAEERRASQQLALTMMEEERQRRISENSVVPQQEAELRAANQEVAISAMELEREERIAANDAATLRAEMERAANQAWARTAVAAEQKERIDAYAAARQAAAAESEQNRAEARALAADAVHDTLAQHAVERMEARTETAEARLEAQRMATQLEEAEREWRVAHYDLSSAAERSAFEFREHVGAWQENGDADEAEAEAEASIIDELIADESVEQELFASIADVAAAAYEATRSNGADFVLEESDDEMEVEEATTKAWDESDDDEEEDDDDDDEEYVAEETPAPAPKRRTRVAKPKAAKANEEAVLVDDQIPKKRSSTSVWSTMIDITSALRIAVLGPNDFDHEEIVEAEVDAEPVREVSAIEEEEEKQIEATDVEEEEVQAEEVEEKKNDEEEKVEEKDVEEQNEVEQSTETATVEATPKPSKVRREATPPSTGGARARPSRRAARNAIDKMHVISTTKTPKKLKRPEELEAEASAHDESDSDEDDYYEAENDSDVDGEEEETLTLTKSSRTAAKKSVASAPVAPEPECASVSASPTPATQSSEVTEEMTADPADVTAPQVKEVEEEVVEEEDEEEEVKEEEVKEEEVKEEEVKEEEVKEEEENEESVEETKEEEEEAPKRLGRSSRRAAQKALGKMQEQNSAVEALKAKEKAKALAALDEAESDSDNDEESDEEDYCAEEEEETPVKTKPTRTRGAKRATRQSTSSRPTRRSARLSTEPTPSVEEAPVVETPVEETPVEETPVADVQQESAKSGDEATEKAVEAETSAKDEEVKAAEPSVDASSSSIEPPLDASVEVTATPEAESAAESPTADPVEFGNEENAMALGKKPGKQATTGRAPLTPTKQSTSRRTSTRGRAASSAKPKSSKSRVKSTPRVTAAAVDGDNIVRVVKDGHEFVYERGSTPIALRRRGRRAAAPVRFGDDE